MKLLVIVWNLGNNAGGIVSERLVSEILVMNNDTLVLCNKNYSTSLPTDKVIEVNYGILGHNRIDKLLLTVTKKEWNGRSWIKQSQRVLNKLLGSFVPEITLSITTAYGFRILRLGYQICNDLRIPFAIHALDPLPSPREWGENAFLRKAIISIIRPYFKRASLISATNPVMLAYQLEVLRLHEKKKTLVVYNPPESIKHNINPPIEPRSFLYLGTLYNKRNPEKIIKAFRMIQKEEPEAKLYFIGDNRCPNLDIDPDDNAVYFIDWTDNPGEYVNRAGILLDIDANHENDVFISSKLNNYLLFDRIILCVTPNSSPSAHLVKPLYGTVITVPHDVESIYIGMKRAIKKTLAGVNYSERIIIREKLSGEANAKKLLIGLSTIVN